MFGVARESLALMMQINKVRIHIGHIVDKSTGGKDGSSNLRTLYSLCNKGAKMKRIA